MNSAGTCQEFSTTAPPLRVRDVTLENYVTSFCERLAADLRSTDEVIVARALRSLVFMTRRSDVDVSDPAAFVIADHLDAAIDSGDDDQMRACLPIAKAITDAHLHGTGFWHTFGGGMICRRISKIEEALEGVYESAVNADRAGDRIDYAFESAGDR